MFLLTGFHCPGNRTTAAALLCLTVPLYGFSTSNLIGKPRAWLKSEISKQDDRPHPFSAADICSEMTLSVTQGPGDWEGAGKEWIFHESAVLLPAGQAVRGG